MIWKLTREHLRAQRRYTLSMGAVVAVAITLTAFAGTVAATTQARDDLLRHVTGMDHDHTTFVGYFDHGDPAWAEGLGAEIVSRADAEALTAQITHSAERATISVLAMPPHPSFDRHLSVVGVDGSLPWDTILLEGRSPDAGEVVLSAPVATTADVGVGDTITFEGAAMVRGESGDEPDTFQRQAFYTVVGIARAGDLSSPVVVPDGYLTLDDGMALGHTFGLLSGRNAQGEETALVDVVVSWDGPVPPGLVNDVFSGSDVGQTPAWSYVFNSGATVMIAAFGILTALGVVAAALAMARNQAAMRTRWVATARALGARRGQLLAAALAEAAVIAAATTIVALLVAFGGTWSWLAIRRASAPEIYQPSAPAVPLWLMGAVAAIAVALSLAVSAAPALWALRTSPVEALKPSPPAASRPMRTLSPRLPLALAIGGFLIAVTLEGSREALGVSGGALFVAVWMIPACAGAVGAALIAVVILQRGLAKATRAVERRSAPWATAAAHALHHHGHQTMVIAGGFAAATGILVAGHFRSLILTPIEDKEVQTEPLLPWVGDYVDDALLDLGSLTGIAAFGFLAVLIAVAVGLSTAASTRADTATHAALGLTRSATVRARLVFQAVPTAVGIAVGAGASLALATLLHAVDAVVFGMNAYGVQWSVYLVSLTVIAAAWVAIMMALLGALAACVVSFSAAERTPVRELADAAR